MSDEDNKELKDIANKDYAYGFETKIEQNTLEAGLDKDVIREISKLKNEPEWLLEFRLEAYQKWLDMKMPDWAHLKIKPINFQQISYYSAPKSISENQPQSIDEIDPELLKTYTFNKENFSKDITELKIEQFVEVLKNANFWLEWL